MVTPRTLTILGATGSVGSSTLDLIQRNAAQYDVLALTAQTDVAGLAKVARAVKARHAVIGDERLLPVLHEALAGTSTTLAGGEEAIVEAAQMGANYTMCAIVGCAGLAPTMAAIAGGKTVAFANKEALVSAGDIMMAAVAKSGAMLLPVDSEHNAIFQCLAGVCDDVRSGESRSPEFLDTLNSGLRRNTPNMLDQVSRIILTASGGPFRTFTPAQMAHITPAQAVKHPNWSMGAKISVDSATMMNKGLELIEAAHLFPLTPEKIEIIVHPQSIIHSMVEFSDGSVLAQLGAPDMRIPIAHTLAYPARMPTPAQRLDLAALARLDFEAPDEARFPALRLARAALAAGGAAPAILNAANEVAVSSFLSGALGFLEIADMVERVVARLALPAPKSVADVLAIDAQARAEASAMIQRVAA